MTFRNESAGEYKSNRENVEQPVPLLSGKTLFSPNISAFIWE